LELTLEHRTHFVSLISGHRREAFILSSEFIKTSSQNGLINGDDGRLVISVDISLPSFEPALVMIRPSPDKNFPEVVPCRRLQTRINLLSSLTQSRVMIIYNLTTVLAAMGANGQQSCSIPCGIHPHDYILIKWNLIRANYCSTPAV